MKEITFTFVYCNNCYNDAAIFHFFQTNAIQLHKRNLQLLSNSMKKLKYNNKTQMKNKICTISICMVSANTFYKLHRHLFDNIYQFKWKIMLSIKFEFNKRYNVNVWKGNNTIKFYERKWWRPKRRKTKIMEEKKAKKTSNLEGVSIE